MREAGPVQEFKQGLRFLRHNYARKALAHFRKAVELDRANPFYLSYLGVATAAANRNWDEAEEICQQAIRMKRTQAELYLNLAEVYRLAERKEEAVETLALGLKMTKKDPRVVQALRKYGVRRPPVIPFLDRKHFLNRELGKVRSRVLKSLGKKV